MVEKRDGGGPEAGLHARPAAGFAKKAEEFSPNTKVVEDGRGANAKSTMKKMTLGARKAEGILIRAEGEDAEDAVEALVELISTEEE